MHDLTLGEKSKTIGNDLYAKITCYGCKAESPKENRPRQSESASAALDKPSDKSSKR